MLSRYRFISYTIYRFTADRAGNVEHLLPLPQCRRIRRADTGQTLFSVHICTASGLPSVIIYQENGAMKIQSTLVPAVLTALLVAGTAFAQDPPSRVARLNWLSGNVSFQPAGVDQWTAATLNYPLTTGDHLYTDAGSRAEIHVGPNALRLNGESNF